MNLRNTLKIVHTELSKHQVDHALIGGLALACYGSTRATIDVDLIIHEKNKREVKTILLAVGFILFHETEEVIQFKGVGLLDILIARRPMAEEILKNSNEGGPEGLKFIRAEDLIGLKIQAYKNDPSRELQDKADIQYLLKNHSPLDMKLIKMYADLFNQWEVINGLKN